LRFRVLAFSILLLACKDEERPTQPPPPGDASAREVALAGAAVLIGAGDIGVCGTTGDERTAAIVDSVLRVDSMAKVEDAVFTMGDNAYPSGSQGATDDFRRCFAASWGAKRIMRVIHPSIGNHDYQTVSGPGYYEYFGDRAGPRGKGYYSFDLGEWHLIALNSEIVVGTMRDAARSKAQEEWLREDLDDHGKPCTLAYWHRPRFSSGTHGATPEVDRLWMILYEKGVDIVVNGHEHHYERFLPQTPAGVKDSLKGIEEIIVGTGGGNLRGLRRPLSPNSAMQITGHFGVLKLTLGDNEYRRAFLDTGGRVWDQGGRKCH
jgi:hypothetical protein